MQTSTVLHNLALKVLGEISLNYFLSNNAYSGIFQGKWYHISIFLQILLFYIQWKMVVGDTKEE